MSHIEVQASTAHQEKIPVNKRDIFIALSDESFAKAETPGLDPETVRQHLADAASFNRLANEPTTDEMRLEQYGTPLPEGHTPAPGISNKIGAAALR